MTTKEDVIKAYMDGTLANYRAGLHFDDEAAIETQKDADVAEEEFRKVLDEFEQALLTKEEKPCKQ